VNKEWHAKNRMAPRANLSDRARWHQRHAAACGCRPIPAKVSEAIAQLAEAAERRRRLRRLKDLNVLPDVSGPSASSGQVSVRVRGEPHARGRGELVRIRASVEHRNGEERNVELALRVRTMRVGGQYREFAGEMPHEEQLIVSAIRPLVFTYRRDGREVEKIVADSPAWQANDTRALIEVEPGRWQSDRPAMARVYTFSEAFDGETQVGPLRILGTFAATEADGPVLNVAVVGGAAQRIVSIEGELAHPALGRLPVRLRPGEGVYRLNPDLWLRARLPVGVEGPEVFILTLRSWEHVNRDRSRIVSQLLPPNEILLPTDWTPWVAAPLKPRRPGPVTQRGGAR
jgi:hypothetical protein